MKPIHKAIAGIFAAMAFLNVGAIADVRSESMPPRHSYTSANLGVVDSFERIRGSNEGSAAAGTVLGGVVGGVLGHQLGSGRGNDAATVAGAVGGAVVGHEIGENKRSRDSYRINVRLDNGEFRSIEQASLNGLRVGDRVRIEGDQVVLAANSASDDEQSYRTDDSGDRYDPQGDGTVERGVRN